MATTATTENLSFEKVWLMFQETDKKFQETREQLRTTKELLDSKFQDTDKKFQETREQLRTTKEILDSKFQDTDKKFQETDKKFQETDKQFRATDKKLNKLEHLFTGHWGKLMETLVEGDLVKLLNNRGIKVNFTTTRAKLFYNDRQYEFDIIAENGDEIVVVEVKTTLKPFDVSEFIDELNIFKSVLPKYSDKKVIGALAFLQEDGGSMTMAINNGLYTIKATGSSASITNDDNFKPKYW